MVHLGFRSIDLLELRSTVRQERVWMLLGVSGLWLSVWLPVPANPLALLYAERC